MCVPSLRSTSTTAWPNGSELAPIVSVRGVDATWDSSSSSTIRHSP
jgi:hypothetical protein